ncbi:MAG: hypothetical protein LKG27_04125 [Clostridiaceae bacterium]|jgi:hypothetical protein|nr:hypothetical protein [Clostridiaceae bacterium]
MSVSVDNQYYNRYETCNGRDDKNKKHVTTGEVATATGATAAGANAARTGTFNMFKNANKIKRMSKETTDAVQLSTRTAKQTRSLFSSFSKNASSFKRAIVKWGETATNSRILKPLLASKAFHGVAGCLGFGTAVFVTIAGIGDIFNTVTGKVTKYES